jgi:hypothetical protein
MSIKSRLSESHKSVSKQSVRCRVGLPALLSGADNSARSRSHPKSHKSVSQADSNRKCARCLDPRLTTRPSEPLGRIVTKPPNEYPAGSGNLPLIPHNTVFRCPPRVASSFGDSPRSDHCERRRVYSGSAAHHEALAIVIDRVVPPEDAGYRYDGNGEQRPSAGPPEKTPLRYSPASPGQDFIKASPRSLGRKRFPPRATPHHFSAIWYKNDYVFSSAERDCVVRDNSFPPNRSARLQSDSE